VCCSGPWRECKLLHLPVFRATAPHQKSPYVPQSLGSEHLSKQSLFRQLKSGLARLELYTYPSFCRPGSSSRRGITDQTSPKRLFHRPPTEPHTAPLFNLRAYPTKSVFLASFPGLAKPRLVTLPYIYSTNTKYIAYKLERVR
jgi:hypothetical protein